IRQPDRDRLDRVAHGDDCPRPGVSLGPPYSERAGHSVRPAEARRYVTARRSHMPHFIVEYTSNVRNEARIPELLKKGVEVLTAEGYPLLGMRARGLAFDEYVLADGRDCAMVHVTLKIAPGRQVEK